MDSTSSFLTREEIKKIVEIGFSCLELGDVFRAEGIFSNLKILLPEETVSYFGLSLSFMGSRDYDKAIKLLEEGISHPNIDREVLTLLLSLAKKSKGEDFQSRQAIKKLSEEACDQHVKKVSQSLISGVPVYERNMT